MAHLRKVLAQVGEGGDKGPVGLAVAERGQRAQQQVEAVADLGLGDPTIRPARRYDSPSNTTAATASKRTSRDSGRVPPRPGWRGGTRWARRPASQVRTLAGSDERGQYANEAGPPRKGEGLPVVRSRTCPAHGAARTP